MSGNPPERAPERTPRKAETDYRRSETWRAGVEFVSQVFELAERVSAAGNRLLAERLTERIASLPAALTASDGLPSTAQAQLRETEVLLHVAARLQLLPTQELAPTLALIDRLLGRPEDAQSPKRQEDRERPVPTQDGAPAIASGPTQSGVGPVTRKPPSPAPHPTTRFPHPAPPPASNARTAPHPSAATNGQRPTTQIPSAAKPASPPSAPTARIPQPAADPPPASNIPPSASRLQTAARLPTDRLVLDGCNFLGRAPGYQLGDPESRDRLLFRLQEYAHLHPAHRVTVFFDGQRASSLVTAGVEQRVTSQVRSADDSIITFLQALPAADRPRAVLVTDDRDLAMRARKGGVRVEPINWLAERLARKPTDGDAVRPVGLNRRELEDWEQFFNAPPKRPGK